MLLLRERYRQWSRLASLCGSINQGHSVWIAQKEGDQRMVTITRSSVLKMLGLAHKEHGGVDVLPTRVSIVPVAISYEVLALSKGARTKSNQAKRVLENHRPRI